MTRVSVANVEEDRSEADDAQRVPFLEPRPEPVTVLEVTSSDERNFEETGDRETEYFDELQEAAAGLAALMRSSPVGKSAPVVYAPEDLEEEFLEEVEAIAPADEPREILLPLSQSTSSDSDVVESVNDIDTEEVLDVLGDEPTAPIPLEGSEVEFAEVQAAEPDSVATVEAKSSKMPEVLNAVDSNEVVVSSNAVGEASAIRSSAPEAPELSLRDLLGDEVADQFDSLDEGLDDLESLVVSIELALSSINGSAEEAITKEEAGAVFKAA